MRRHSFVRNLDILERLPVLIMHEHICPVSVMGTGSMAIVREGIGIVKIPKINLEYPILEIGSIDPESAKAPMKISIIKYWGENVNDYGNLSIAGHNNKDGTMFGKTKKLEIGDIIELTDLKGQTIQYSIYDIFVTDPNDVSILLPKDEVIREVTLITCTNGNKQRLILKAKEI